MFRIRVCLCVFLALLACALPLFAQQPKTASTNATVPPIVNFTGVLTGPDGKPSTGTLGVTFALYKDSEGGAPLWIETQNVQPDRSGHYSVMLGSASREGLPASLFAAGEARWLGVQSQGQAEQPRVLLMSVPYALKALDAETIGGKPASAFVMAPAPGASAASGSPTKPGAANGSINPSLSGSGTKNFIPVWLSSSKLGNSNIFQTTTGKVGIGTTSPSTTLDVNGASDIRGTLKLFPSGSSPTLTVSGTAFNVSNTGLVTFISGQKFPGTGTITGVKAGSGLTGGGNSGKVTLGLLDTCSNGQVLQWNGTKWVCSSAGTGDITGVTAGTDLTGGGNSGAVTLNLDTTKVPQLAAANTFTNTQTVSVSSSSPALILSNGSNGDAVVATSTQGIPISGETERDSDFFPGVLGVSDGVNTETIGVTGYTSSPTGMGVYGQNVLGSSVLFLPPYAGVWGDSSDGEGLIGTSDNYLAIQGINNTDLFPTLLIENETSDSLFGTLFTAFDSNVGGSCNIDVSGDLTCSGEITGGAMLVDGNSRKVALTALEATENWFEDAGSGRLSNGAAAVHLDATFAQTVNTGLEYHVFLTPKGDCEGLYVDNETPQGFVVHELRHGRSNIAFDYRIMAKRKGYENVRLADVTQRMKIPVQKARPGAQPIHVPSPRHSGIANSMIGRHVAQASVSAEGSGRAERK